MIDKLIVLAAVVALVVSGIMIDRRFLSRTAIEAPSSQRVPVQVAAWEQLRSSPHRIGASNPIVTLLVFADFQCPACKAFDESAVKGLLARYPEEVGLVFRHLPLPNHPKAYIAARAAECAADQGHFWKFHDELYRNQAELDTLAMNQLASAAGVMDTLKFKECVQVTAVVSAIESDIVLADAVGAGGTPTVIIDGYLQPMVPDSAELDQMIRQRLKDKP
jgi:protein-disulfide isomerase